MSDLISRNRAISILEQLDEHILSGKMDISNAIYLLENQPTAYDIDKVVEELEEVKMRYFLTIANTGNEKSDFAYENVGNVLDKAIEIVKAGERMSDIKIFIPDKDNEGEWRDIDEGLLDLSLHDEKVRYKAIIDYMNKLCNHCMQQENKCDKSECPFCSDGCDIVKIAERLKAGGKNG